MSVHVAVAHVRVVIPLSEVEAERAASDPASLVPRIREATLAAAQSAEPLEFEMVVLEGAECEW